MRASSGQDWAREEVEAIVADYLHMLTQELGGQSYNKTAHRKALQSKLRDRSDGSIERKHQNISAVLIKLGCPYVAGYKPLPNYQALLFDVVADRLAHDRLFDQTAMSAAEQPAVVPLVSDFAALLEPPPRVTHTAEPSPPSYVPRTGGLQRDYLNREARNRSLGTAGEAFVVAYERYRLHAVGAKRLSDRVEHVSETKGDGLGFDVLSFEVDGRERFIEVKTTAFGKETPFFISRNEVEFSGAFSNQFHLYRLFEFRRKPRMFDLAGDVQQRCHLDAVSFLARFV
jgi:Domain of unknown function (DUF3883)